MCPAAVPVLLFAVADLEAGKKSAGKARDESMIDKKHELEKRLENVKGALGAPSKKPTKKGLSKVEANISSDFMAMAFYVKLSIIS